MKRIALVFLFSLPCLAAVNKPTIPPGISYPPGTLSCVQVRFMERVQCILMVGPEWADIELVKNEVQGAVALIGLLATNPDDGHKVMSAAPYLNFPELEPFNKSAPGWCVCSSSVQKDQIDPWNLEGLKPTGKGRCQDLMVCSVKGVAGSSPGLPQDAR